MTHTTPAADTVHVWVTVETVEEPDEDSVPDRVCEPVVVRDGLVGTTLLGWLVLGAVGTTTVEVDVPERLGFGEVGEVVHDEVTDPECVDDARLGCGTEVALPVETPGSEVGPELTPGRTSADGEAAATTTETRCGCGLRMPSGALVVAAWSKPFALCFVSASAELADPLEGVTADVSRLMAPALLSSAEGAEELPGLADVE